MERSAANEVEAHSAQMYAQLEASMGRLREAVGALQAEQLAKRALEMEHEAQAAQSACWEEQRELQSELDGALQALSLSEERCGEEGQMRQALQGQLDGMRVAMREDQLYKKLRLSEERCIEEEQAKVSMQSELLRCEESALKKAHRSETWCLEAEEAKVEAQAQLVECEELRDQYLANERALRSHDLTVVARLEEECASLQKQLQAERTASRKEAKRKSQAASKLLDDVLVRCAFLEQQLNEEKQTSAELRERLDKQLGESASLSDQLQGVLDAVVEEAQARLRRSEEERELLQQKLHEAQQRLHEATSCLAVASEESRTLREAEARRQLAADELRARQGRLEREAREARKAPPQEGKADAACVDTTDVSGDEAPGIAQDISQEILESCAEFQLHGGLIVPEKKDCVTPASPLVRPEQAVHRGRCSCWAWAQFVAVLLVALLQIVLLPAPTGLLPESISLTNSTRTSPAGPPRVLDALLTLLSGTGLFRSGWATGLAACIF